MKSNFIEAYNSKFSTKLFAILIFVLGLFFTRQSVFLEIDSKIIGGVYGDSGLYYYLAKSFLRNFTDYPYFQTSMYYPYGYTLAWSDNFILPSAFINFLNLFFSFNTSYNLCFIIAWVLNGFCLFLLLYFLTGSIIYSILPSMLFCINTNLGFVVGHPQLQFVFFIPLGIYYLFKYLLYEKKKYAFYLGITIFLSFITTVYYAVFLCLIIFFLYLSFFLLKPRYILKFSHIKNFCVGLFLGIIPILSCFIPYYDVKNTFKVRGMYEANAFSSNFLSYFSSSPLSYFYSKLNFSHAESLLFVGIIPIIAVFFCYITISKGSKFFNKWLLLFLFLFFIGSFLTIYITAENNISYIASFCLWSGYLILLYMMMTLRKLEYNDNFYILSNRGLVIVFLFLFVSLMFLSFGPLGSEVTKSYPTGLYYVLYHIFPGVNAIRAISRTGIFVILMMYILFSLNFYLLSRDKKYVIFIFIIFCIINFYEQKVTIFQMGKPQSFVSYSKITKKLNKLPSEYKVIYLPFRDYGDKNEDIGYANYNVSYMIHSLSHNHSIINGYSGQRGRVSKEYPTKMSKFPDERSVNTLAFNYNLKYIIFDGNRVNNFDSNQFEEKLKHYKTQLKTIYKDKNVYLIEYKGSFKNRKTYYLNVPKYLNEITIQIKTKNSPREKEHRMIMVKNKNNNTFVDNILPSKDDEWINYKINLSKTFCDNRVSPYRLTFTGISNTQKIYIKNYN